MASDWHVSKDRQQTGPFTSAELRKMVASGQLGSDDFVWKEGMQDWVPASKIKGLFVNASVTAASPVAASFNQSELVAPVQTRISAAINTWRNLNAPTKIGIASVCAGLLLVVFCAGILALIQGPSDEARSEASSKARKQQEAKERQELIAFVELGNSLWNEGKKEEAVAEYKRALNFRGEELRWAPFYNEVGDAEKPTVLQRTIEFEFSNGNTSAASHLINEAVRHDVSVSFNSQEVNRLVIDAKAKRALDEAKREAQNKIDDAEREGRKRAEKNEAEPQGPAKSSGWTMFANGSLTKAKYDKIKEGMSYAEVKGIIGEDGEEMASSKMDGVSGVVPSISTKMYVWKNSNGSNMNAMFQNGRMIQKAQFGLK